MFILIYDPYQNLNADSMVWVFNTKDEAVNEMREQFFDLVIEETDVEVDDGHIYTYSPLDNDDNWIDEWQAFLGEGAWVIHEVPGAFIPEDQAMWFRRETNYAKRAYSNPDRYDYDYADDACKNVAYELYDRLGYPTLASMRQEAEGTILDEFEELPVEVFNSEYGYQHPIDADGDMWFCTIGVPDDEHGYVVVITEEDGIYTCRFTQGGKESCVDEGPTPEDAWEASRKKFLEA